jgi:hypothetical protein
MRRNAQIENEFRPRGMGTKVGQGSAVWDTIVVAPLPADDFPSQRNRRPRIISQEGLCFAKFVS